MTAIFIRILLRYLAGALVVRGIMGADDAATFSADQDVQMLLETGLGVGIASATEIWHWLSRKFGWEH